MNEGPSAHKLKLSHPKYTNEEPRSKLRGIRRKFQKDAASCGEYFPKEIENHGFSAAEVRCKTTCF